MELNLFEIVFGISEVILLFWLGFMIVLCIERLEDDMKIVSKYSEKEFKPSELGERVKQDYMLHIDKDGKERLVENGVTDVYEKIQQFEPQVNLRNILDRYMSGDEEALNKVKGFYADVANLPGSTVDFMNLNLRAQNVFAALSPEYRALYGGDYQQFLANPQKLIDFMNEASKPDVPVEPVKVEKEKEVADGEQE